MNVVQKVENRVARAAARQRRVWHRNRRPAAGGTRGRPGHRLGDDRAARAAAGTVRGSAAGAEASGGRALRRGEGRVRDRRDSRGGPRAGVQRHLVRPVPLGSRRGWKQRHAGDSLRRGGRRWSLRPPDRARRLAHPGPGNRTGRELRLHRGDGASGGQRRLAAPDHAAVRAGAGRRRPGEHLRLRRPPRAGHLARRGRPGGDGARHRPEPGRGGAFRLEEPGADPPPVRWRRVPERDGGHQFRIPGRELPERRLQPAGLQPDADAQRRRLRHRRLHRLHDPARTSAEEALHTARRRTADGSSPPRAARTATGTPSGPGTHRWRASTT